MLQEYFPDRVPHSAKERGGWRIRLDPYPDFDYYVDPALPDALPALAALVGQRRSLSAPDLAFAVWEQRWGQLSLHDSWTLGAWSEWARRYADALPDKVVVLRADDHLDDQSPLVARRETGSWRDLVTGAHFALGDVDSVTAAIESSAVGIGSFLVPLLHHIRTVEVRHLRVPKRRGKPVGRYRIRLTDEPDSLLEPTARRMAIHLEAIARQPAKGSTFRITDRVDTWVRDLPDVPVLVHIDADYFSNRYDGDSAWEDHAAHHDPEPPAIHAMVDSLVAGLHRARGDGARIESIALALSPGFFPAEHWVPTVNRFAEGAVGLLRGPAVVWLKRGSGSTTHGGGPDEKYWHVYDGDTRAGYIYTSMLNRPGLGRHASIQIMLNEHSRNRGIGRRAYQLAAEDSGHDLVYAHMRRSNEASRRAAAHAGFVEIDSGTRQLSMVWRRPRAPRSH